MMTKLVTLKTWEIKFLNEQNWEMGMSLWDAMMSIKHPANIEIFFIPLDRLTLER